jgi:hypothetical protein
MDFRASGELCDILDKWVGSRRLETFYDIRTEHGIGDGVDETLQFMFV